MKQMARSPLFMAVMGLLVALALAQTLLPDRARSDLENRPLQQMEAPRAATLATGRWMETMDNYVSDQFVLRDQWMLLQAVVDTALLRNERNGLLVGSDGWLFEPCAGLDTRTAEANLRTLDALAAAEDRAVSLMLVPMSSMAYPEVLPNYYGQDNQLLLISGLYEKAKSLHAVDVSRSLRVQAAIEPLVDTYALYYRTDHHWTYDGAMLGYEAWMNAEGLRPACGLTPSAVVSGFYGTYYARAPSPFLLAESFAYDEPEGVTLQIDGEPQATLHDPAIRDGLRDKYAGLLHGTQGYITLLNEEATGGRLFVIKDSYANAMLTLLARHYNRIDAVDPRYYGGDIRALMDETEAESILCVYGLTTFLSDRSLLLHGADWGG